MESRVMDTNMGRILVYSTTAIWGIAVFTIKRRCEEEDEALKKEFGQQWNEWSEKVPYAILPGIL